MASSPVLDYTRHNNELKRQLMALYDGQTLEKKEMGHGRGWTWGYRMIFDGTFATGASIGVDEMPIFFDLPHLINARTAYCLGVAFGVSTFASGLTKADLTVYGLDDYSERSGPATSSALKFVQKTIDEHFSNIRLHIGRSPEDIPKCLETLPQGNKLDLVFIDGEHTNDACRADYAGIRPFIDENTIVLWHNIYAYPEAFEDCYDSGLFDTRHVLKTHGSLGIYYNQARHPDVRKYLENRCLVWHGWTNPALNADAENYKPTGGEISLIKLKRATYDRLVSLVRKAR